MIKDLMDLFFAGHSKRRQLCRRPSRHPDRQLDEVEDRQRRQGPRQPGRPQARDEADRGRRGFQRTRAKVASGSMVARLDVGIL